MYSILSKFAIATVMALSINTVSCSFSSNQIGHEQFEINQLPPVQNFTQELRGVQQMVESSENVKVAHQAYREALVQFHEALPTMYYNVIEGLARNLKASYESWLQSTGKKLEFMDSGSFEKFYQDKKSLFSRRKSHHVKYRRSAWYQLEKLRNDGRTLDTAIQMSHANLAKTELRRSQEYFTDCAAAASKSFKGWHKYEKMVHEYGIPVKQFSDAVTAIKEAKAEYHAFMEETPGLKEFMKDEDFDAHFLRGISANEGIPKASIIEEEMEMYPNNKLIKKAHGYIQNIDEVDRLKFNFLFQTTLVKARAWSEAARQLDDSLLQLSEVIRMNETDHHIVKANDYVVEAIEHRQKLNKVWLALHMLNQRTQIAQYHASAYQKEMDEREEFAFTFKLILNLALIIGGSVFCVVAKKQMFSEEDSMEGGEPEYDESNSIGLKQDSSNSYKRISEELLNQNSKSLTTSDDV